MNYRYYITTVLPYLFVCLFSTFVLAQDRGAPPSIEQLLPFESTSETYRAAEVDKLIPNKFKEHPEYGVKPFNCKFDSVFELIQHRTLNTRLLVKKGTEGKVLYKQKVYGKFHYKDERGWWRTIDQRLRPKHDNSEIFLAPNQPVPVRVDLANDFTSLKLIGGLDFKFNRNTTIKKEDTSGKTTIVYSSTNRNKYWYGTNGIIIKDYFPGIDREVFVGRGRIKTNFRIEERPEFLTEGDFLIIEDSIKLPEGFRLEKDLPGGYHTINGDWYGKLKLIDSLENKLVEFDPIKLIDKNRRLSDHYKYPAGYRLIEFEGGYLLQMRISGKWMSDTSTPYPIIIDPLVRGSDTFQQEVMGFTFAPGAGSEFIFYCPYDMTVSVPGRSELTALYFEFESRSDFFVTCDDNRQLVCKKNEIRIHFNNPCGPTSSFICPDPLQLPGRCTTATPFLIEDALDCLKGQCPPHKLDFQIRLSQMTCPLPDCDTLCHRSLTGSWIMTAEARRLEGLISAEAPYCKGDTVKLTADASWGVPPYNYLWLHNGDTNRKTFAVPTTDSTFICRIRDSCSLGGFDTFNVVYDTIHMKVRDNPDLSLSATDATCFKGSDGTATALASGTQSPYLFEWNTDPIRRTNTIDSLPVGTYKVTVTDIFGCDTEDSVIVGFINVLDVEPQVDSIICFNSKDGSISLNITGNPPYDYIWSTGDTIKSLDSLGAGIYKVTVTDNLKCTDTATVELTEPPFFSVDAGNDKTILEGERVQLQASISEQGAFLFNWIPTEHLSDPTLPNPFASPDSTTLYIVAASRINDPDCRAKDSVLVEVLRNEALYIPTAFSPNNDGINDFFETKGEAIVLSIKVFDRWGNLVYNGTDKWDGTYRGVDRPLGTYVYVIRYRTVKNGDVKLAKGNVTLIR